MSDLLVQDEAHSFTVQFLLVVLCYVCSIRLSFFFLSSNFLLVSLFVIFFCWDWIWKKMRRNRSEILSVYQSSTRYWWNHTLLMVFRCRSIIAELKVMRIDATVRIVLNGYEEVLVSDLTFHGLLWQNWIISSWIVNQHHPLAVRTSKSRRGLSRPTIFNDNLLSSINIVNALLCSSKMNESNGSLLT